MVEKANLNNDKQQSNFFDDYYHEKINQEFGISEHRDLQRRCKSKMDRYNQQKQFILLKLYLLTSLRNFQQVVIRGVC